MRRSWARTLPVLAVLGCGSDDTGGYTAADPLYDDPPEITDLSWSCSVDEETWTFAVDTAGWTANGTLYLAQATDYVESHTIRSQEAAADGSADHLELELAIEPDWREVTSGSSTAFACNASTEAALCFRVVVYTPGTEEVSDCRSGGADPTLFDEVEGIPACDEVWTGEDTGAR